MTRRDVAAVPSSSRDRAASPPPPPPAVGGNIFGSGTIAPYAARLDPRSRRTHLRTRFRPLHGNFNPIRNIFRGGRSGSPGGEKGNDGTKTAGHRESVRNYAEKKNAACGERRATRWVNGRASRPIPRPATASRDAVTRPLRAAP